MGRMQPKDGKLLSTGFLAEGHFGDDKVKRTLATLPCSMIYKCIDDRVHGEASGLSYSINFFDQKFDCTDSFPFSFTVTVHAVIVFLSCREEPSTIPSTLSKRNVILRILCPHPWRCEICRLRLDDIAGKEWKRMGNYSKSKFVSPQ
jgi:hypothetical protein